MKSNQHAALKRRNDQRRQAIEDGGEIQNRDFVSAVNNIVAILSAYEAALTAAREHMFGVQKQLAAANRDVAREKQLKVDCMHTVNPLQDKLDRIRRFLAQYTFSALTVAEKSCSTRSGGHERW